jgi:hypothetical protein
MLMPGTRITKEQVTIYMKNRQIDSTQKLAAAKSGISERSGRDIDNNKHWTQKEKTPRAWQTRQDPFKEVWEQDVIPLLQRGIYEATFVLEELQKKHSDKFFNSHLRSLQRKVKQWRALFGEDKEVMFRQENEPGKLGISDFTHPGDSIKITINGEYLEHIFYHFRLPYSGYNYMQVFKGSGEPFDAFAQGLQEALQLLGGVPKVHRTDSLSASFKNLNKDATQDLTERYRAFAEHYGMQATRINPGKSNENGSVEASHGHIKNRIEQSLIIRGSVDFISFDEYRSFIQDVIGQHNQRNVKYFDVEQAALNPLPATKAIDYTEVVAVVSSSSTINVKRVTYSVPSRLIGESLFVRIYNDKLACYLGSTHAITFVRVGSPARGKRARKIDYRHFINSLVKKPGAFRGSKIRNDIMPNDDYRRIWEYANCTMNANDADKFIVGLLHLAATYDCQDELAQDVLILIERNQQFKLIELQNKFKKHKQSVPDVHVVQHMLSAYNSFIPSYQVAQWW